MNNMKKINYFIKKDQRIKKVYDYAKKKYLKANKPQHNWEHIIRDLYRGLVIAETIKDVNYSVLIPAIILHDIGVTESRDYKKHAEVGARITKRDLSKMGYTKKEIEQIAHCVKLHKERGKPDTLESKIVFDADLLEKSGIGGIFSTYRAQYESRKPIGEWTQYILKRKYTNKDFFTKKGKEISGDGFIERRGHFKKVEKSLKRRKDWTVIEKDLWN